MFTPRLRFRDRLTAGVMAGVTALLLTALPAWGDGMPGVILGIYAFFFAIEAVIISVEAVAYWALLGLRLPGAVCISTVVNMASAVAGIAVAFSGGEAGPGAVRGWALPGLLTLVIEVPLVTLMIRFPDHWRVARIAAGVNLTTWGVGTAILYGLGFGG